MHVFSDLVAEYQEHQLRRNLVAEYQEHLL
jgi:hypothetical protein